MEVTTIVGIVVITTQTCKSFVARLTRLYEQGASLSSALGTTSDVGSANSLMTWAPAATLYLAWFLMLAAQSPEAQRR
jgi:hypothetical protein